MSLRLWDPDSEHWTIHWLDSRRPGYVGPPVRGGFTQRPDGPFGIFYGDDEIDGRAIRVRYIWSRITKEGRALGAGLLARRGQRLGDQLVHGFHTGVTDHVIVTMRSRGAANTRWPIWDDVKLAGACRLAGHATS